MHRLILAAGAVLALGACATNTTTASTSQPAGRDCFQSDNVSGYGIIDDNHVRVTAGASRHYILGTSWNARELNWEQAIALRSSSGWICVGNGLGVEIIGGRPPRNFPVNSIEREPPLGS